MARTFNFEDRLHDALCADPGLIAAAIGGGPYLPMGREIGLANNALRIDMLFGEPDGTLLVVEGKLLANPGFRDVVPQVAGYRKAFARARPADFEAIERRLNALISARWGKLGLAGYVRRWHGAANPSPETWRQALKTAFAAGRVRFAVAADGFVPSVAARLLDEGVADAGLIEIRRQPDDTVRAIGHRLSEPFCTGAYQPPVFEPAVWETVAFDVVPWAEHVRNLPRDAYFVQAGHRHRVLNLEEPWDVVHLECAPARSSPRLHEQTQVPMVHQIDPSRAESHVPLMPSRALWRRSPTRNPYPDAAWLAKNRSVMVTTPAWEEFHRISRATWEVLRASGSITIARPSDPIVEDIVKRSGLRLFDRGDDMRNAVVDTLRDLAAVGPCSHERRGILERRFVLRDLEPTVTGR